MMKAFGMNKDRLYMALYIRNAREGDVHYHTALLRIPKGAGLDDKGTSAFRYHAINPLVNGQEVWAFEALATRPMTIRLRALVYLGKTDISPSKLQDLLKEIQVVQGNPDWRCHNWIWAAMQHLHLEGMIDPLPKDPESIWRAAMTFADDNPIEADGLVPTCATNGERIKSAFEGL